MSLPMRKWEITYEQMTPMGRLPPGLVKRLFTQRRKEVQREFTTGKSARAEHTKRYCITLNR